MCGIAGWTGSLDEGLLAKMAATIAHRGPDDSGIWEDRPAGVGLAHRRLAILDLSPAGHQPMHSAGGRYIIVFNGEIYNFKDLRSPLAAAGYPFRGTSDTEVILALWERHGASCLKKLNGIFALAVWDTEDRTLTLARDGLGVKPLYITQTAKGLRFASEMKALLLDTDLDRSIDPRAVRDHITYMYCPGPRTILTNVLKAKPGELIVVKGSKIQNREQFYTLPFDNEVTDWSMQEAAERVREAVQSAVARQMVSDVPVGAFLSGGLDSSAIVAFAKEQAPSGRIPCFTIAFSGGEGKDGFTPDLPYAHKVAKLLDLNLHPIVIKPQILENFDRMLWHLDEPTADTAAINVLLICEEASRQGIKVLLSGTGGDDLFAGYRRHFALLQERKWGWLPKSLRKILRETAARTTPTTAKRRRIAKAFAYADMDDLDRLISYFRWAPPSTTDSLLSADIRAEIRGDAFSASLRDALDTCPKTGATAERLHQMLYLEATHYLPDHNLNYTDKMSMAVGVETRVPLIDTQVVDLALRISGKLKQRGRTSKAVLKESLRGILPDRIIHRTKAGFGAPMREWMDTDLRPLADDLLSEEKLRHHGLFDAHRTRKLLQSTRRNQADGYYILFAIMCMHRWCETILYQPATKH